MQGNSLYQYPRPVFSIALSDTRLRRFPAKATEVPLRSSLTACVDASLSPIKSRRLDQYNEVLLYSSAKYLARCQPMDRPDRIFQSREAQQTGQEVWREQVREGGKASALPRLHEYIQPLGASSELLRSSWLLTTGSRPERA